MSEEIDLGTNNKKNKWWIWVIVIVIIAVVGYFAYGFFAPKENNAPVVKDGSGVIALDPVAEASHISKVAGEEDAYWMRGNDTVWNDIETKEGKYDWDFKDQMVKGDMGMTADGVYNLSIIWPYANWDQESCHSGSKYEATGHLQRDGENLLMGAPCDMEAYGAFLEKVVERYDGDGVDDMPGLEVPIKYWEVLNEPSMQGRSEGGAGEDLKFFVGTSAEYLEILKTSYTAIKKADPTAKVLHAGMAGMQEQFKEFWNPVFKGGAGDYFDIANIHSINTDERREDMYLLKFKDYLSGYGITDKPIWITEAQFGNLQGEPDDIEAFNSLMAKSTIFSLALGAEKIFLIENWTMWGEEDAYSSADKDKEKKRPLSNVDLDSSTTHKLYKFLVKKLGSFDKVEAINEEYRESEHDSDGATSSAGQYKFTDGSDVVYVLWGKSSSVPSEISGSVTVTDIYGEEETKDASTINITDTPIFVEVTK